MGVRQLGKIAQQQVHSGDDRHTFNVRVQGRNWTKELEAVTISYSNDGTSECTLMSHRSLNGLENSRISVDFGYGGDEANYFTGRIAMVDDRHWGTASEATAWGPFRLMAEQVLLTDVDYSGKQVDAALLDIVDRAGYRKGNVDVRGRGNFQIEAESIFPLEAKLSEVANTLCEAAGYVMADRPEDHLVFMPRPRTGAYGRAKYRYNENHFQPESFTAVPTARSMYARVIVFRRNEAGTGLDFYKDIPIEIESEVRPPQNRAYIIADFPGSERDAEREARSTADALESGFYDINLTGIAANPDILLHDTLTTTVTEFWDDDRYLVTYKWNVDQGITVNLSRSGNWMDLQGTGIRTKTRKLARPYNSYRSSSIVR